MQDTFIKLLTSLDTYKENGHFKQYLMQIARNLSKNYLTRVQNKENIMAVDVSELQIENNTEDNLKVILELNGLLSPIEADIVIKKIVYNFKFIEIAEDNNLTLGETQAIYYRALLKVKNAYEEAERV